MINAAISFTPDTFGSGSSRPLGRRVANLAFLRAALAGRGGAPIVGYGYEGHHEAEFAALVRSIAPGIEARWAVMSQIDELARQKVVHRLDHAVGAEVAARAWTGLGGHSISAVVHTLFNGLPGLAALVRDPLTTWDALICTSRSARSLVEAVFDAERDYARWRYGAAVAPMTPQLPVIPLGVHTDDFSSNEARRQQAREALQIGPSEVVALYLGRLSLMSKAHPGQMYQGLQAASRRCRQAVTLVECGWPKTESDGVAIRAGAQLLAPGVRHLLVNGQDDNVRLAWDAADLFISLSDNIQETFGLTPLEAMAAGLPVVASDWNGYRDTVRDGVDGFLIPTWAPAPTMGNHLGFAHQSCTITDDMLSWGAAASTSVDMDRLVDALSELIANPDLRRRMGASGQARARAEFDWRHVYCRYQALWSELDARRLAEGQGAAAPRSGGQLEPFTAFAAHPTHHISGATVAALRSDASLSAYQHLAAHTLFPAGAASSPAIVPLWRLLEAAPRTLADAATDLDLPLRSVVLAASVLAKMGFVELGAR